MNYNGFLSWCENIILSASRLGEFLTTPINIGSTSIAPIYLVGVGGLIVFIGLAIVKWVIS